MNLSDPGFRYVALGAVLGLLLARGRRSKTKKLATIVTGAAFGAGVAYVAPRVGVNLPGLPSQVAKR